jgi:hypothetical protein
MRFDLQDFGPQKEMCVYYIIYTFISALKAVDWNQSCFLAMEQFRKDNLCAAIFPYFLSGSIRKKLNNYISSLLG